MAETGRATPWAPPQHKGMSCACRHWDAAECARLRSPQPFGGIFHEEQIPDPDDECDCCCHDEDEDD